MTVAVEELDQRNNGDLSSLKENIDQVLCGHLPMFLTDG